MILVVKCDAGVSILWGFIEGKFLRYKLYFGLEKVFGRGRG